MSFLSADERTDLERIGLIVEDSKADNLSGDVVNDQGDPISERPALRQRERKPGSPEAVGSRDNGQINVPDVIGVSGSDDMIGIFGKDFFYGRWFGLDWVFDKTSAGRGTDFCAGNGEEMSEPFFAHERAEDFKALDEITDKVRKLIDPSALLRAGGVWNLDKGIVVKSFEPGSDGVRINHEDACGLGDRPAFGGHDFKDGLAFNGDIAWPLVGRDSGHAASLMRVISSICEALVMAWSRSAVSRTRWMGLLAAHEREWIKEKWASEMTLRIIDLTCFGQALGNGISEYFMVLSLLLTKVPG